MALKPPHVSPELVTKIKDALGIIALEQWYYVSRQSVANVIGNRALNNLGGIPGFLKAAYPDHKFDQRKLLLDTNIRKQQKFFEVCIQSLFPNTEIQTNTKKGIGILNPQTKSYLEIDIWLPSLKLGFEYQEKHHFVGDWFANETLAEYQMRDKAKEEGMHQKGHTLIHVGCWWDKSWKSLVATIRKARPDLLQHYSHIVADPIPPQPPPGFFELPEIPGVAGPLMSPKYPGSKFDPKNWWAGVKEDGFRGVWNPKEQAMFSRAGKPLSLHASLLADLPQTHIIEGELVCGRGQFSKLAAMSHHSHHSKVDWPQFRFVVYDIPDAGLGNYVQRYSQIVSALYSRSFIFPQIALRVLIASKDQLRSFVELIISDGGEGAILQRNTSYEHGRSNTLMKIKVRRDSDALVLRVNELSCTCTLLTNDTVEIPYHTNFDPSEISIGDVVSYYHSGFLVQNGTPRNSSIYRVRHDVAWETLVNDHERDNVNRKTIDETKGSGGGILLESTKNKHPLGHWNDVKNIRAFFCEFADKSGFDPLVADNWYYVTIQELYQAGGRGLFNLYNKQQAIQQAFPELQFNWPEKIKKNVGTKEYWKSKENQRTFFEDFANQNLFDPLVPQNWYMVALKNIIVTNGVHHVLANYNKSLPDALISVFPQLNLQKRQFLVPRNIFWKHKTNRRAYFDEIARFHNFDPLNVDNWYELPASHFKLGKDLFDRYYDGSRVKALVDVYPELQFEQDKFNPEEWTNALPNLSPRKAHKLAADKSAEEKEQVNKYYRELRAKKAAKIREDPEEHEKFKKSERDRIAKYKARIKEDPEEYERFKTRERNRRAKSRAKTTDSA